MQVQSIATAAADAETMKDWLFSTFCWAVSSVDQYLATNENNAYQLVTTLTIGKDEAPPSYPARKVSRNLTVLIVELPTADCGGQ